MSYYLSAELVIAVKMQVVLWTDTVFLRPLHKNYLLIQQLINATVGLVKTCLQNIIAIICSFRNKLHQKSNKLSKNIWELKKKDDIDMGYCLNMFVDHKSVIMHLFVKSSLFQEQIQKFYSINVMCFFRNTGIKINFL